MEAAHFFEGTEKLLEIWFSRQQPATDQGAGDLRTVPGSEGDILLESSMFVSKRHFILKTCGTSLLLKTLVPLLKLARDYSGFDSIQSVSYSRKNFLEVSHQGYSHLNFQEEIEFLNAISPKWSSILGRMYSECWYLSGLDFPETRVNQSARSNPGNSTPAVWAQFYIKYGVTMKAVTCKSGIHDLSPGSVIVATLFNPRGYWMNGMKSDGTYWTIHITPQPEFSFFLRFYFIYLFMRDTQREAET
ncbi:S-adenosylmethionine decarboxylase proenzyme-like [Lycaon pictus]